MSETTRTEDEPKHMRWRSHAAVLALGTFAVGTDAFVIAGLLPDISDSLHVSVGAAGQLVSVFSMAYALLSPVLAALTSTWSRRTVLITALLIFALGNGVTALAPDYGAVLAARIVAAAGAALFTPNAGVTAASLAGPRQRGRAIAIVTVGLTSSLALGAPLGTLIGNALGWQATMWFVTALALPVIPVLALRLPAVAHDSVAGLRQRLTPLTDRKVAGVLAGTLLAFVGIYLPYTYISEVFRSATGGDGARVALLLLVFGLAGTVGNLLAGRLADRLGPRTVVLAATLALTAVFLLVVGSPASFPVAMVLVALSGTASWSVTAPQQQRLISLAPAGAESVVVSLNAAVMYLAISVSSVLGAALLDASSPGHLSAVAAGFTLVAAAVTALSGRPGRRMPPASPHAGQPPTTGGETEKARAC
ncbi:MFS transporter [Nocardia carnea]|uniref:MFS transporter n=1 Tax=Nocardia carnea TaxID=37328 RepID=UPI0024562597|nr:MFS transporter [Nocardia carnea]